jgi:GGDEF domain-containing protein
MISIKRFLERRLGATGEDDVVEAAVQMGRLLLDAISTHAVRGRDSDGKTFAHTLTGLLRRLDEPPSSFKLLEIASEAVEAIETHALGTTEYFREQNEQMQAMLAMLTQTLADISGQTDGSVTRLQAIEQQIVRASGLDDIRALSSSLESCLAAVREAAVQQKKSSMATVGRLRDHIEVTENRMVQDRVAAPAKSYEMDLVTEADTSASPEEREATISYVAAFKLQRSDHIVARFGAGAKNQMLSLISQTLKSVLGPQDRLLRWKGTSFVMFLNSSATISEIRVLLTEAVGRTGQHYIEVGKKTALISIGVDWIVFPRSQCPSLDAVFTEVDSFLVREKSGNSPRIGD